MLVHWHWSTNQGPGRGGGARRAEDAQAHSRWGRVAPCPHWVSRGLLRRWARQPFSLTGCGNLASHACLSITIWVVLASFILVPNCLFGFRKEARVWGVWPGLSLGKIRETQLAFLGKLSDLYIVLSRFAGEGMCGLFIWEGASKSSLLS